MLAGDFYVVTPADAVDALDGDGPGRPRRLDAMLAATLIGFMIAASPACGSA